MGREQSSQNETGSELRERVCQTEAVVTEETSLGDRFLAWQQKPHQRSFPGSLGRAMSFPKPQAAVVGTQRTFIERLLCARHMLAASRGFPH